METMCLTKKIFIRYENSIEIYNGHLFLFSLFQDGKLSFIFLHLIYSTKKKISLKDYPIYHD